MERTLSEPPVGSCWPQESSCAALCSECAIFRLLRAEEIHPRPVQEAVEVMLMLKLRDWCAQDCIFGVLALLYAFGAARRVSKRHIGT